MTPKSEESTDFYTKWSKVIKNMELPKRKLVWQGAIEHLINVEVMEPTMSDTLSQAWIQEIIMTISTDPIYTSIIEVFDDFSKWFIGVKKDSLPAYVETGEELWLLYLMLRFWDMVWDGKVWRKMER